MFLLVKILVARDVASTPKLVNFPLIFLYPFYVLWLELPNIYAEWSELFQSGRSTIMFPTTSGRRYPGGEAGF